jgi:hypothetical protein
LVRAAVVDAAGVACTVGFGYVLHVIPFLAIGDIGRLLLRLPAQEQVAHRINCLAVICPSCYSNSCYYIATRLIKQYISKRIMTKKLHFYSN